MISNWTKHISKCIKQKTGKRKLQQYFQPTVPLFPLLEMLHHSLTNNLYMRKQITIFGFPLPHKGRGSTSSNTSTLFSSYPHLHPLSTLFSDLDSCEQRNEPTFKHNGCQIVCPSGHDEEQLPCPGTPSLHTPLSDLAALTCEQRDRFTHEVGQVV